MFFESKLYGYLSQSGSRRVLLYCARIVGGAVFALGSIILLGWLFKEQDILATSGPTMKANTAFCFFLLGMALAFLCEKGWGCWLARLLATGALLIASMTAIENITGVNFDIDQLLARDFASPAFAGRMSPISGLEFVLIAAAVLLLTSASASLIGTAAWLGILTLPIAGGVLAFHILAPEVFSAFGVVSSTSFHSTAGFILGGIAILAHSLSRLGEHKLNREFVGRRIHLFAIVTMFGALSTGIWGTHSYSEYRKMRLSFEEGSAATARLLEEHAARAFDAGIIAVDRVVDLVADGGIETFVASGRARERIRALADAMPHIGLIAVADAGGNVRMSTRDYLAPVVKISDILGTMNNVRIGKGPVFGFPISTGSARNIAIPIIRTIIDANGNPAGVAVAAVDVDYFRRFYESLPRAKGSVIGLYLGDGRPVVRLPAVTDDAEKSSDFHMPNASSGTFVESSSIGDSKLIVSYRRVPNGPLIVVAAEAVEEMVTLWSATTLQYASLLVGIFAMFTVFIWSGLQAIHREEAAMRFLEEMATVDALTQISNRPSFFTLAEREIQRARRFKTPLSVIMFDVDRFKQVNDTHGHKAGDDVLYRLSAKCLETLRDVDVFGRIGGEEFAVVVPGATVEGACQLAERLRTNCAGVKIPLPGGDCFSVTISAGFASAVNGEENISDLLERADAAMYRAKRAGRDRVEAA